MLPSDMFKNLQLTLVSGLLVLVGKAKKGQIYADLGDLPSLSAGTSVGRMISYHFSDHISIKPAKHSQTTENTQHEDDVHL